MKLKHIPYFGRRIESLNRRIRLSGYRSDMFDADEGVRWGKAALDFGRSRRAIHPQSQRSFKSLSELSIWRNEAGFLDPKKKKFVA